MASRTHLHLPKDFGARAADVVVGGMGSWRFVIIQTVIVLAWVGVNIWLLTTQPFDPYPFILLNLAFSLQAAYASPLILMASNRQADKDRARDALEAQEVDEMFAMQKTQLDILNQQTEILTALHDLQKKA